MLSTQLHCFPSCKPFRPVRHGTGLSAQPHVGSRLDGRVIFSRLRKLLRLAPWRQQNRPSIVRKVGPGRCGTRLASFPFTLIDSAPVISKNSNRELGASGSLTVLLGLTFNPSVLVQSHTLLPRLPPRAGGGRPFFNALPSSERKWQMVEEHSPCLHTSLPLGVM